jgi:hypothetical protein
MKKIIKLILLILLLLVIFFSGIITQKKYGIGNIIKKLNPSYVPADKQEIIKKDQQGKLSIFILAGQSNMEGSGDINDYKPIDTQGRIYVFNENFNWIAGKEPVRGGVGPSISFAAEIINKFPNKNIGLVNVARGETNIQ